MSFIKYCEKCKNHTRHVSKEKLGTDEDKCIRCPDFRKAHKSEGEGQ